MVDAKMVDARDERRNAGVEGDWIAVAAFAGSHGVRGDVRLRPFTEDPDAIFGFAALHKGPGGPLVRVKKLRADKDGFIVRVDGITNREDAMLLKGKQLYVERAQLGNADEEDEFYLADLIGLEARDGADVKIGFVRAVENFGAGDLIELVLDTPVAGLGRYAFIPFTKILVPTVDVAGGYVGVAFSAWLSTQDSERAETEDQNYSEKDA